MDEKILSMLKYLHLSGLLANWDRNLKLALEHNFSPVKLLQYVIEQEYNIKKANSRRLRIKRAAIPEEFVIETFPFDRQPKLNKKKVLSIYDSFDYMKKNQNVIWVGATGSGKTGLATSFLINALNNDYTGRFIAFPELIETLYKSIGDHSEHQVMNNFVSYDCLVVDELGYVEIEPVQVGLFFTLMNQRHKKKTTLITSNLGFSEWTSFLKNNHLTAALIDRLTENSYVINMKNCDSLRSKLE